MSTTYYECHLTLLGDPAKLKPLVEATGWKFSCIDGDIILGDGVKCYATKHFNTKRRQQDVLASLNQTGDKLERQAGGGTVIRRKIEHVIHDDRSSKVRIGSCNGGCPECHLDHKEEAA